MKRVLKTWIKDEDIPEGYAKSGNNIIYTAATCYRCRDRLRLFVLEESTEPSGRESHPTKDWDGPERLGWISADKGMLCPFRAQKNGEIVMNKWELDFTHRIRVKDRCVLTDAIGYEHFHTMKGFCTLFEVPYIPELALESLVESEQAIWVELTPEELQEFKNERPWWQRWLHDLLLWMSKGSKG